MASSVSAAAQPDVGPGWLSHGRQDAQRDAQRDPGFSELG